MTTPQSYFGISCPEGGDFYICESSSSSSSSTAAGTYEFVGCCTVDPCVSPSASASSTCPLDSLRVMTFQQNKYEELPPQLCAASSGSAWYSCKFTTPPFLGCCKNNPCDTLNFPGGCGRENLTQGRLEEEGEANRFSFLSLPGLATTTTASTTTSSLSSSATTTDSSSTTGTAASEVTPDSTSAPETPGGGTDGNLSTGAIVGIVGGAVVVTVVCVGILMYRCGWSAQRRRHKRQGVDQMGELHRPLDGGPPPHMSPYHDSFQYFSAAANGATGAGAAIPGYHDPYGKYHPHPHHQSPRAQLQYGGQSPESMLTDQTAVQGGGVGYHHSRQASGGAGAGLGVAAAAGGGMHHHHQDAGPQELPAASSEIQELPTTTVRGENVGGHYKQEVMPPGRVSDGLAGGGGGGYARDLSPLTSPLIAMEYKAME